MADDTRTKQITARICGAVLALERKKRVKKVRKLLEASDREPANLRKAARESFTIARMALTRIETMTLPVDSPTREEEVYMNILEIELHQNLTYPSRSVVNIFNKLVIFRRRTIEHMIQRSADPLRLPAILTLLFEKIRLANDSRDENELLRCIIRRFKSSSCVVCRTR
eukprot:IDg2031t1